MFVVILFVIRDMNDEVNQLENAVNQDQFIFNENEFESESFDAQQFVNKYRRVTSLESLRQQLRQCADHLKNQLYMIINKDYKDFINIATKVRFIFMIDSLW